MMKPFKRIAILFKRSKWRKGKKANDEMCNFLFYSLFGKTDRIKVGGGRVFADAGFCSTN